MRDIYQTYLAKAAEILASYNDQIVWDRLNGISIKPLTIERRDFWAKRVIRVQDKLGYYKTI